MAEMLAVMSSWRRRQKAGWLAPILASVRALALNMHACAAIHRRQRNQRWYFYISIIGRRPEASHLLAESGVVVCAQSRLLCHQQEHARGAGARLSVDNT